MANSLCANRGSLLYYIVNVEKNMRGYFEIKNELTGRSIIYDCDKYIFEKEVEERYICGYKGNVKLWLYPVSTKVIIKDIGGNIVDTYTADTTSAYAIIIHT